MDGPQATQAVESNASVGSVTLAWFRWWINMSLGASNVSFQLLIAVLCNGSVAILLMSSMRSFHLSYV